MTSQSQVLQSAAEVSSAFNGYFRVGISFMLLPPVMVNSGGSL